MSRFFKTYCNLLKYIDRVGRCNHQTGRQQGEKHTDFIGQKKLGYIVFGRQQGVLLTPVWAEFNRKRREFLRSAFRSALARSRAFSVIVMGFGIS